PNDEEPGDHQGDNGRYSPHQDRRTRLAWKEGGLYAIPALACGVGGRRRRTSLVIDGHDLEEPPVPWHALQLVDTTVLQCDPGARNQVPEHSSDQDLACARCGHGSGG